MLGLRSGMDGSYRSAVIVRRPGGEEGETMPRGGEPVRLG